MRRKAGGAAALLVFLCLPLDGEEPGLRRFSPPRGSIVSTSTARVPSRSDEVSSWSGISGTVTLLRESEGRVACGSERTLVAERRPAVALGQINHLDDARNTASEGVKAAAAGLQIILRGTAQLESRPEAKAAFVRAAEIWESMMASNVTIYVDVDFGPTAFGEPFPDDRTLGATQSVLYKGPYTDVRTRLRDIYSTDTETLSLPATTVPSDIGGIADMILPDAALRVIGLLPSAAAQTDAAPSIGFNSSFPFDFDPSDGIGPADTDFLDVAIHEMGHVLGFTSTVGAKELDPLFEPALSPLDLHRFRPGVVSFPNEMRILSSGGEQVYFTLGDEAPLSTGRSDGTGGDLRQASHWKDDLLLGSYVGLMDPVLPRGIHLPVTLWDLVALNRMGWFIALTESQPWITELSPDRARPGSGSTTVVVSGQDFAPGAKVLWKGQPRTATRLSDASLSFVLSAADLASDAIASVEVQNPGSIPSNTAYFKVSRRCYRCTLVVER